MYLWMCSSHLTLIKYSKFKTRVFSLPLEYSPYDLTHLYEIPFLFSIHIIFVPQPVFQSALIEDLENSYV